MLSLNRQLKSTNERLLTETNSVRKRPAAADMPCVDSQLKRPRRDLSPRLTGSRAREIRQPLSDIQVDDVTCPGHQGTVQAEVDVSEDNVDDGICPGHEGMVQAKVHVGADNVAQEGDKKRKRPRSSLEKNEAAKMKHNILEPCGTQCRRKCYSKMDEEQRVAVHKAFWEVDFNRRRAWLSGHIKTLPVKNEVPESSMLRNRQFSLLFAW